MSWDDLCGEHKLMVIRTDVRHPFDENASGGAIQLDDITVFVFEDPGDNYRSSAIEPMIIKAALYEFGCDSVYIRAPVVVKRWTKSECGGDGADGIEVVDSRNGKTILLAGTDNYNDYYPSYTFDWRPQNLAENEAVKTAEGAS